MLTLYRRHVKACPHTSRQYRRCKCPIHVEGSLRGEKVRKALDLTSWEAASDLIAGWNAVGEIGAINLESPTVSEAVSKFIEDAKARHLGWETIRKYESLLERRFLPWCESEGYRLLKQVGVDQLRTWRATWTDGANYALKNVERLRAFFRFCHQAGWLKANPATALKAPEVRLRPTLPFSAEEMKRIVHACDRYRGNKARMKAFVLVMRYTGLRLEDAIKLSRDQVVGAKVALYTSKTGEPVSVPIPPQVQTALSALGDGDRYFWSGTNIRSAKANWSRYLDAVFELAKVDGARSHRFRDTAAANWLMTGMSVEEVATLLGNSPAVVVKHYSPWIRERQERLESKVKASWSGDQLAVGR